MGLLLVLLSITLAPAWAKVEKIPSFGTSEYKLNPFKVSFKAIDNARYGLFQKRTFKNKNFQVYFGLQTQLDPFYAKQETIEILICLAHFETISYTSNGKTYKRIRPLSFYYRNLELKGGSGKSILLKSEPNPFNEGKTRLRYFGPDFNLHYYRIDRAVFEELLAEKKLTLIYTVDDEKTLVLTMSNINRLKQLDKIVKADPYWVYCQPGSEHLPPIERTGVLQSDQITPLLGKHFDDPEMENTLSMVSGQEPRFGNGFLNYPKRGIAFQFSSVKILEKVEVNGIESPDGRNVYRGALPGNILITDSREVIIQKIGPPVKTEREKDKWAFENFILNISFQQQKIASIIINWNPKPPAEYIPDQKKLQSFPPDPAIFIGKNTEDQLVNSFINRLGNPKIYLPSDEIIYDFPNNCISIVANKKYQINEIRLYQSFSTGKYLCYPGLLPGGIQWCDNRTEVEKKLGPPIHERGELVKYSYSSADLRIRYDENSNLADPKQRLMAMIYLMPKNP